VPRFATSQLCYRSLAWVQRRYRVCTNHGRPSNRPRSPAHRIPSAHRPPRAFPLSPGVNSSALSTSTAGTTASASTVPLRPRLLRCSGFMAAAISRDLISFLMRGQSGVELLLEELEEEEEDEPEDELRRWKGDSEERVRARVRAGCDGEGGERERGVVVAAVRADVLGREGSTLGIGMLISVYSGSSAAAAKAGKGTVGDTGDESAPSGVCAAAVGDEAAAWVASLAVVGKSK
jgi:hypothetical protein